MKEERFISTFEFPTVRELFRRRLELVLCHSWGLVYLGFSLNLLEVGVFLQTLVNFDLLALLFIERLVEHTASVVLACMVMSVQGAGRSLTFLMC